MQKAPFEKIILSFFISFLIAIFQSAIFSTIRLNAFAPFFIITFRYVSLLSLLWISFFCGWVIDLFSTGQLGIYPLNYCLCCLLFHRFRKHFFEEKPINLYLFTSFFSIASQIIHCFLFFLFDRSPPLSGKWLFTDLIGMSCLDGVYAFFCFFCLIQFIFYLKKKIEIFVLTKK